jgi:hypothetical protein
LRLKTLTRCGPSCSARDALIVLFEDGLPSAEKPPISNTTHAWTFGIQPYKDQAKANEKPEQKTPNQKQKGIFQNRRAASTTRCAAKQSAHSAHGITQRHGREKRAIELEPKRPECPDLLGKTTKAKQGYQKKNMALCPNCPYFTLYKGFRINIIITHHETLLWETSVGMWALKKKT